MSRRLARGAAVVLAALAWAACDPARGPLMAPGQDCLTCHDGGKARAWSAAGTWSPGSRVTLTDAQGKVVSLRGNRVGNFYTAEGLAFPLRVTVDGSDMPLHVVYGGCNRCHGPGAQTLATGPLMLPHQDCLACHDGTQALGFTAAGTWGSGADTVTITDASARTVTLHTNQAGNFYTSAPLVFPLQAAVNGTPMPQPIAYGGCNRCHTSGGPVASGPTGPLMAPNQDCIPCHDGTTAKLWTVAGTWGSGGDTVNVRDALARTVRLATNAAGNFYTDAPLTFPLQVDVNGAPMPVAVAYGGCNKCHTTGGPIAGSFGPLMDPGQDCLTCHDGAQAKRWTVAGTFLPAGQTVTLVDRNGTTATATTNSVGNFYTEAPLVFPLQSAGRSGSSDVMRSVVYGGCNRCHGPGGVGGD